VEYDREIIIDNYGENIALDWVQETPEEKAKSKPIVFLLPGLTGHS
jgi:predicted alpha/beta-fold hydrolase